MFVVFSKNRTNYRKGQIFPFLIAIICVVIILIMITVNLGQIGIFRTDVSNAADAAALAGASVLSGALLGFGIQSDIMAGYALAMLIAAIIALAKGGPVGIVIAIAIGIAFYIKQLATWIRALGEAKMAWTNAKQTAISYAFNNAGIDEPRPSFEDFLRDAYQITDSQSLSFQQIQNYYAEYLRGESLNARRYGRNQFSKFMEDNQRGYWDERKFRKVRPGVSAPVTIRHGYGWEQDATGRIYSSYHNPNNPTSIDRRRANNYKNYENYVEVEVIGSTGYPLMLDTALPGGFFNKIGEAIDDVIPLPWWLEWIDEPIQWIFKLVGWIFKLLFPTHLTLGNGMDEDMTRFTDENPLRVRVTRYKRGQNLGLWNFRYGEISAGATSHAYRENSDITIENTGFLNPFLWIACIVEKILLGGSCDYVGDTERHLFETKLISVH